MKQSLRLLPLFLTVILAGCADTETPSPMKRHATAEVTDIQSATNGVSTNALTDTNASLVDTNGAVTNAITSPANPFATPTPVPAAAPRDLPYGTPVPGKPGYVTSPHSPNAGYVDVRGFPPGSEVKDPYSGKIFLVP
jgi:hypothetical protein